MPRRTHLLRMIPPPLRYTGTIIGPRDWLVEVSRLRIRRWVPAGQGPHCASYKAARHGEPINGAPGRLRGASPANEVVYTGAEDGTGWADCAGR